MSQTGMEACGKRFTLKVYEECLIVSPNLEAFPDTKTTAGTLNPILHQGRRSTKGGTPKLVIHTAPNAFHMSQTVDDVAMIHGKTALATIEIDAIMGIIEINEDGPLSMESLSGGPHINPGGPKTNEFLVVVKESVSVAEYPSDYPACFGPDEYSGVDSSRSDALWESRKDSVAYNIRDVKLVPFQVPFEYWYNDELLQAELGVNTLKMKRGIELFFSKNHYYSYDLVLTQTQQNQYLNSGYRPHGFPALSQHYPMFNEWLLGPDPSPQDLDIVNKVTFNKPLMETAMTSYMWNSGITGAFKEFKVDMNWLVPVIQGYIGWTSVTLSRDLTSVAYIPRKNPNGPKRLERYDTPKHTIDIYIIGRREWHRSGTRYHCRGIDTDGNVSNFVETEMIVHVGLSDPTDRNIIKKGIHRLSPKQRKEIVKTRGNDYRNEQSGNGWASYVQIRGSVPLLWEQSMVGKNPVQPPPVLSYDRSDRRNVCQLYTKHFKKLTNIYGDRVFCFNLLSSSRGNEHVLTEEWDRVARMMTDACRKKLNTNKVAQTVQKSVDSTESTGLPNGCPSIRYIDFHKNQKTHGFIPSLEHNYLVEGMSTALLATGPFQERPISHPSSLYQLQKGVCRTNCLDCLDRTNAFQYWIGWMFLRTHLMTRGFKRYCEPTVDIDIPRTPQDLSTHCHALADGITSEGERHWANTCCAFRMRGPGVLEDEEPMDRLVTFRPSTDHRKTTGQYWDVLNPNGEANPETQNLFQFISSNMWGEQGDRISQVYTGTGSVITPLMVSGGKTSMNQKMNHITRSVNRFYQNLVEDQNRNEVIKCIVADWRKHEVVPHRIIDDLDDSQTKKMIQRSVSGPNELDTLLNDLDI